MLQEQHHPQHPASPPQPSVPRITTEHVERVCYNLHYRLVIFCVKHSSSKLRSFLELFWCLLAVSAFSAVICLHSAFVYRGHATSGSTAASTPASITQQQHPKSNIPLTCLVGVPGFQKEADVIHLVLWNRAESLAWQAGASKTPYQEQQQETSSCPSVRTNQNASRASLSESPLTCQDMLQNQDYPYSWKHYFSYSKMKGFAMLPPSLYEHYRGVVGLSVQIVAVSKTDARCFGEPFLQQAVFRLLGPDTVMLNWLLAVSDGSGYIYNPRTDVTYDLSQYYITNGNYHDGNAMPPLDELAKLPIMSKASSWMSTALNSISWCRPWTTKFTTAVKTLFLYFVTSTMAAFLVTEMQNRVLTLNFELEECMQANRPLWPVIRAHLIDNVVFAPVLVGMIFFLQKLYRGDARIAAIVLYGVWFGEVFSVISIRSVQGIRFFPRAFFYLFALFHFYLFSFPFGFSYVAMGMVACFMAQCCLFFFFRYELPAFALGLVSMAHTRMENDYNHLQAAIVGPTRQRTATAASFLSTGSGTSPTEGLNRSPVANEESTAISVAPLSLSISTPGRRHGDRQDSSTRTYPLPHIAFFQPRRQERQPGVLETQAQQLHYSASVGTLSQGRMSRASSEAIFRPSGDQDDESFVFYLGGEVVIHRGHDPHHGAASTAASSDSIGEMNQSDSSSTLHSLTASHGAADEVSSGLHHDLAPVTDLTPRLCNVHRERGSSGAPVFPVLGSSRSIDRSRQE